MRIESIERWVHDHTFRQDQPADGERKTLIVIVITAVVMVVEIAVITSKPRPPASYWDLMPDGLGLVHFTVEVHTFPDHSNCE